MSKIEKYVKDTNKYKENLNKEYRVIFDEILVYLRTSCLPEKEIEVTIQDTLSIFLEAQSKGKAVKETIGEDYKEFCDELIDELKKSPESKKRIILSNISIFFNIITVLLTIDYGIDFLKKLLKGEGILIDYSLSMDTLIQFIMGLMIVYFTFKSMRSTSFKFNKSKKQKFKEFGILYVIVLIFLGVLVGSKYFKLEQIVLFNIKIYVIIPIAYLIMKLFRGLSNK